jgi:hypothetical protein
MMNLVNSKVVKSSRTVVNRSSESVSAYSCELFIESFKILHRGYVYFLWSSNHSQIHSLRYEANGKTVQVKETLTISLRITAKNGRDLPSSVPVPARRPSSNSWQSRGRSSTSSKSR